MAVADHEHMQLLDMVTRLFATALDMALAQNPAIVLPWFRTPLPHASTLQANVLVQAVHDMQQPSSSPLPPPRSQSAPPTQRTRRRDVMRAPERPRQRKLALSSAGRMALEQAESHAMLLEQRQCLQQQTKNMAFSRWLGGLVAASPIAQAARTFTAILQAPFRLQIEGPLVWPFGKQQFAQLVVPLAKIAAGPEELAAATILERLLLVAKTRAVIFHAFSLNRAMIVRHICTATLAMVSPCNAPCQWHRAALEAAILTAHMQVPDLDPDQAKVMAETVHLLRSSGPAAWPPDDARAERVWHAILRRSHEYMYMHGMTYAEDDGNIK